MTQEQRVLLASAISAVFMVAYIQLGSRQLKPEAPQPIQSQPTADSQELSDQNLSRYTNQLNMHEDVITIMSDDLILEIGKSSAAIHGVTLKKFSHISTHEPLRFGDRYPILVPVVNEQKLDWKLQTHNASSALWEYIGNDGVDHRLLISLEGASQVFRVELVSSNASSEDRSERFDLVSSFGRSDELSGRNNMLEIVALSSKDRPWQRSYLRYFTGSRHRIDVPRGTSIVTLAERYFCQSITPENGTVQVTIIPTGTADVASAASRTTFTMSGKLETSNAFKVYVGPRDFFRLREAGFERAFHVGVLATIGLVMTALMKGIASVTHNYGIAVIIVSLIVSIGMSPFTLISFRSMRKMRELQPKIDQLRKKYAKDPQKMNQETFALFKEHRVSPMSGCLPLLLQMPIFFAMWSAISHIIEIRGERFLWIRDLSLPDKLAEFPLGIDLNILPIVMAGAMFFQTKMSQVKSDQSESNEMSKIMAGPLMPILFGFMFYNMPSCLVLYWLTNSLTTMAFYKTAKA